jgi:esterase/lipase superfamily enzyme
MMGKQGVPILFSWPAGSPGLLQGYIADADSSTASAGDLARLLYLLRDVEGLEKVHLFGYSRGCDVVVKAVYDLALAYHGYEPGMHREMKLENVVLLGADVDNHYMTIRFFPAYAHEIPEYMTIYTSPTDSLVGLSGWLRGGRLRLGSTVWTDFSPDQFTGLRQTTRLSIVDARVSETGSGGHGYWRTSSACSSDLVLMIREGRRPGAENGRPLATDGERPVWIVRDGYPNHMVDPEAVAAETKKMKDRGSAYE